MQLVANEIMNPEVLCVQHNWSVNAAAEFLSEQAITGAPVVDDEGNILGVVSASDIARYASRHLTDFTLKSRHSDYFVSGWEDRIREEDMHGLRLDAAAPDSVTSIMTSHVYSVDENCPIFEIAEIMIHNRIHRVLVTQGNLLVGIVTTLDLLRILARPGYA
jgi:CBS domain-containing protein